MTRVLIVEDNAGIAGTLRSNLEFEGFHVDVAGDGELALRRCAAWEPDLIILDLMLPGVDGFQVLRTLRSRGVNTPVLILSALGAEIEKVRGFRLGADDYVTKPFGLLELLARVDALLRRGGATAAAPGTRARYEFGSIVVNVDSRTVTRAGETVVLRPKEFDLLVALLKRPGHVVPKKVLLREVWGYDPDVVSRTVDSHLFELRRKLEDDPSRPRHFKTLRGAGCQLDLG
jgi:two-component system, OmpR family, alkaline phosphatase synthesis response regulator PhoP